MQYLGKDYKFRFSVAVSIKIAKLCPGGDISRLREAMTSGGVENYMHLIATMAVEMNRAYILNERFESHMPIKDWEPIEPITEDMVLNMDNDQFRVLSQELLAVYRGESAPTQNVEPTEKKTTANNDQQA